MEEGRQGCARHGVAGSGSARASGIRSGWRLSNHSGKGWRGERMAMPGTARLGRARRAPGMGWQIAISGQRFFNPRRSTWTQRNLGS